MKWKAFKRELGKLAARGAGVGGESIAVSYVNGRATSLALLNSFC